MKKLTAACLLLALLLSGCGGREPERGFLFPYAGVTIAMDQEAGPVLYRLGAPLDCSQSPSPTQPGMDTVYHHEGFGAGTYPCGSAEHFCRLWFTDGSVTTAEGIGLGSSREAVALAYGCGAEGDILILEKGNTRLAIGFTSDRVTSVEYALIGAEG